MKFDETEAKQKAYQAKGLEGTLATASKIRQSRFGKQTWVIALNIGQLKPLFRLCFHSGKKMNKEQTKNENMEKKLVWSFKRIVRLIVRPHYSSIRTQLTLKQFVFSALT